MIALNHVTKVFDGKRKATALEDINLEIEKGQVVSIVGPSGSGKSTLLNLIGGLDRATSGQIRIEGEDLAKLSDDGLTRVRRDKIGFVFQFFNLLSTLTAVENVALPLLLAGQPRGKALNQALAALDPVGLVGRADHFPEELSGGEMQRVAIARALVTEPEAVLCDEPTGNLDSANAKEILALLRRLPDVSRRAVVMVTHDPTAASIADRIIHIRDGLIDTEETSPLTLPSPPMLGERVG